MKFLNALTIGLAGMALAFGALRPNLAGLAPTPAPTAAAAAGDLSGRTISVSGSAEVKVAPDEVVLRLGILTDDARVAVAKNENDQIAQKVLALIKAHRVDPKDINSGYLNIRPRYNNTYDQYSANSGYVVEKNIVVVLRDLTQLEGLMAEVLEAGVNQVNDVEFRTTQLRQYRDQARALAIKAAQEKATALAKELGQAPGLPLSINEEAEVNYWWQAQSPAQNVSWNSGSGSEFSESILMPGQIAIKANVAVTFDLQTP